MTTKIMYKNQYRRKLNGYRPSHRNRWLLIKHKVLSLQELSLLEFYIDISDFDTNHENFGQFEVNFFTVAENFGCSPNTIRNWHKNLTKLDIVKPTSQRSLYKIKTPKRYILPGKWGGEASDYAKKESNQPIEKIVQSIGIKIQPVDKSLQHTGQIDRSNSKKKPSIALGSFKDDFSKRVVRQEVRSDEEYQRIYEEDGYRLLLPEDMKWIDQNIAERA